MKACLIVIDVQESFRQRASFSERDLPAYLAAQNRLIDACVQRGLPVVRVFHVDGPAEAGNPFAMESGHVKPLAGLQAFEAATTLYKNRHSALVGTALGVWLTENNVGKLLVSGIRTEQCCETTTRHASDLGYAVDYVLDATLTFDMQHANGTVFAAADIKTRTATVLAGRFATVCSVDVALQRLD